MLKKWVDEKWLMTIQFEALKTKHDLSNMSQKQKKSSGSQTVVMVQLMAHLVVFFSFMFLLLVFEFGV